MARRKDIQYVRFYTAGTAAPRVERREEQQVINHPAAKPAKRIPLAFDPVAVIGTAVAVVMLLCVLVGFAQNNHAASQVQEMETYISGLKAQNSILQAEYEHGYDLNEVRVTATSLGMIPRAEAQHITVPTPTPVEEETTTWWEEFVADFMALFA